MAAASPPKNCENVKKEPARSEGRKKASNVCPCSMMMAATPRNQSMKETRGFIDESIGMQGRPCHSSLTEALDQTCISSDVAWRPLGYASRPQFHLEAELALRSCLRRRGLCHRGLR